jgi:hypothetical protein
MTGADGAIGIGAGGALHESGREGGSIWGRGEGIRWVPRGTVGPHVINGEKWMKC